MERTELSEGVYLDEVDGVVAITFEDTYFTISLKLEDYTRFADHIFENGYDFGKLPNFGEADIQTYDPTEFFNYLDYSQKYEPFIKVLNQLGINYEESDITVQ